MENLTTLTFGEAIEELKKGKRICRSGWNGKNMYIYLNKGSKARNLNNDEVCLFIDGINSLLFDIGDNDTVTRYPNINMRSATGATVTGWLASQTDILAEDWMVVN